MYTVKFSDVALKKLKKMDRYQASLLIGWIEKNLVNCTDPKLQGKPLTANQKGKWRYRVGDYRILALMEEKEITIIIIGVGHQKDIYQ